MRLFRGGRKVINALKPLLWIAPALVFLILFLIQPSIETILLSFQVKIDTRESRIITFIMENVEESGRELELQSKLNSIPDLHTLVGKVEHEYGIGHLLDEIDGGMSIKTLSEIIVTKIYEKNKSAGQLNRFAGFENYRQMFSDDSMLTAFRNNLLWMLIFTFCTVCLGLMAAVFIEKVKWKTIAKSVIFIPMAISYVACAVIWGFMYDKDVTIGTVNSFISFVVKVFSFGRAEYEGIAFLGRPETVNFALIIAGIWMWVGFCMVIFIAALKNVPDEIVEAAKIDGAGSPRIFFRIIVPHLRPTIMVVATTMVINVLKIFDIVYTMTQGGPFGASEVIANRMYRTAFNENNFEYAAAMAVILFIAIIPFMIVNVREFLREEKIR